MKCSALNVDFNGVRFDALGSMSPPYERIKFGCPLESVRFLLLPNNLAREWLQIDTDLLHRRPSPTRISLNVGRSRDEVAVDPAQELSENLRHLRYGQDGT